MDNIKKLENYYNSVLNDKIKIIFDGNHYQIKKINDNKILLIGDYWKIKNSIQDFVYQVKNDAKENAKDILIYGYSKKYWNSCGLNKELATKIWNMAKEELLNL